MPPRSRDVAALRRFAEAHAHAHAKAVTVRPDAACGCRQQRCAAHEGTRTYCAGSVVLVLRHDPAVGQVWTLTEVCSACAPLMTHARVVGRAVPHTRPAPADGPDDAGPGSRGIGGGSAPEESEVPLAVPAGAPARSVPGGFSASAAGPDAPRESRRRPRDRGRPGAGSRGRT
jgi:hypothetical protein